MEKNKKYNTFIFIGVFVVIIMAIIMLARNPEQTPRTAPVRNPQIAQTTPEPTKLVAEAPQEPVATLTPEITKIPPKPKPGVKVTPEKTPFNPEDQPREHFVIDLTKISSLPDGYTLENLQLTDKGIQLLPPKPGEENNPRFGVLESAPENMNFPANAISPFWREDLPNDTSIFVEVCVSPDAENWTVWNTVIPDTDMASGEEAIGQYKQDGTENLYYQYTPGGVFFWGMKQHNYFKFRVNLYSETADSPTLSGFRVYYQDSTLGEGHIAEINVPEGEQTAPTP